jgi:hypothetical protein
LGEDDKLTGIVTTADTTANFHKYAGDLMMIEGVEVSIKEAIEILYGGLQEPALTEAIRQCGDDSQTFAHGSRCAQQAGALPQ